MRLTIELEPEQLFTSFLAKSEVEEVYKQILKSYRDEMLLWSLISMTLDVILNDYREEQEWYVQRQIDNVFGGKEEHAIDQGVIVETEEYIRATKKISAMVKLLQDGEPNHVNGD